QLRMEILEDRTLLSLNPTSWTPLGPAPINRLGSKPDYLSVAGQITGIAVDPRSLFLLDSNPPIGTAYVATASAGMWKTPDGGHSWAPKTDDRAALSMGAVAVAPSNPAIVYAGTGEANNNADRIPGVGVLRSDDGGDHWSLLGGNTFQGSAISS